MNMHVDLPIVAGPRADIRLTVRRDDRDLIKLCLRAKKLFEREHATEQLLFDATDHDKPQGRPRRVWEAVVERLKTALGEIAIIQARTGEGMAYKAALLSPWVAAGFDLDEPGCGFELALSIALDARVIGMGDVTLATSQRPRTARPPRSDVGQPAHI